MSRSSRKKAERDHGRKFEASRDRQAAGAATVAAPAASIRAKGQAEPPAPAPPGAGKPPRRKKGKQP